MSSLLRTYKRQNIRATTGSKVYIRHSIARAYKFPPYVKVKKSNRRLPLNTLARGIGGTN